MAMESWEAVMPFTMAVAISPIISVALAHMICAPTSV